MAHILNMKSLFPKGEDFSIDFSYNLSFDKVGDPSHDDDHIHSTCEVYVNLQGDVSFSVEDKVYPIKRGDIIITKPNEVHRCIYHSDCTHECYCFWINSASCAEDILSCFFSRKNGEGNLIRVTEEAKEELFDICKNLFDKLCSEKEDAGKYAYVFRFLDFLNSHRDDISPAEQMPSEISEVLDYINRNYRSACSVGNICDEFFISRSTLQRRFREYMHTTPAAYIETKRLALAKKLLESGASVGKVCVEAGFSDYSHFISLFKQKFGMTPHKYGKTVK